MAVVGGETQDVVIIARMKNKQQPEAAGVFVYLLIWGVNEPQRSHFLHTPDCTNHQQQ